MIEFIEEYYKLNYNALLKKIRYRATSLQDAEDILHNAFTNALLYKEAYQEDQQNFDSWFGTILHNALKRHLREQRSMGTWVEPKEGDDDYDAFMQEDNLFSSEIRREIHSEIESQECSLTKSILTLYFIKGYRTRDIVHIVDASYDSIRKRVKVFKRKTLRKYL